jgi:hypothetical protein
MSTPIVPPFPNVKRRSPAGCLAGCLIKVLGVLGALVFGCLVVLAVYVIVAPWGFYLGGQFHPLAYWQGWGTMHGPGGDYAVVVHFFPNPRSRSGLSLSGPSVSGSGSVCTPDGEKYDLRLSGGFTNRLGFRTTDTNGQPFGFTLNQRLNFLGTNYNTRLSFSFHGTWQNPNLVVNDRGTLTRAFNPDGTWTPGDRYKRPLGEPIPLTLHPGSGSEFDAACAAVKRR